jgi:hypothetical protein
MTEPLETSLEDYVFVMPFVAALAVSIGVTLVIAAPLRFWTRFPGCFGA